MRKMCLNIGYKAAKHDFRSGARLAFIRQIQKEKPLQNLDFKIKKTALWSPFPNPLISQKCNQNYHTLDFL